MKGFYIDKVVSIHKFSGSRPHWHAPAPRNVHYLAYHTAGKNTHIIRGKRWNIQKDTLLFISKEDAYDVHLEEETHSICVAFSSVLAPESFALSCEEYPQIRTAFLNLFAHKNMENPENLFYCLKTIYDLFYFLQKEIKAVPSAGAKDALRPAVEYIRENYLDGSISNAHLAGLCGYGERHFISLFKEAYGKTPNQYIIHKKIDMAVKLLETNLYRVGEVAEMSGFSDLYYFSKAFKKHMQISPAEYRKKIKQK